MRRARANRKGAQATDSMPRFLSLLLTSLAIAAPAFAQRDIGDCLRERRHPDDPDPRLGDDGRAEQPGPPGLQRPRPLPRGRERLRLRPAVLPAGPAPGPGRHHPRPRGRAGFRASAPGRPPGAPSSPRPTVAVEKTNGLGLRGFFASRLVFIGERTGHQEIYTADLFFGDVRQITHDRAIAMTPRWAPDGEKVIYTSFFKSGSPDIFEIDLGTYQRTTFVSFKGTNSGAHFSPDGRQVAMVLSGEGEPEIYVSNANGRNVSRRTHSDEVKASPCWSPDGTRLVFTMQPGPQLYVMAASGGTPAAGQLQHGQQLLRRAGLEPRRAEQDRLHDEGGRQLPDRGPRPVDRTRPSRSRRRPSMGSSPPGCRTGGTWSTPRAPPRPAGSHPRHRDREKHAGQPVEPRLRRCRPASGRARLLAARRRVVLPGRVPVRRRSTRPRRSPAGGSGSSGSRHAPTRRDR